MTSLTLGFLNCSATRLVRPRQGQGHESTWGWPSGWAGPACSPRRLLQRLQRGSSANAGNACRSGVLGCLPTLSPPPPAPLQSGNEGRKNTAEDSRHVHLPSALPEEKQRFLRGLVLHLVPGGHEERKPETPREKGVRRRYNPSQPGRPLQGPTFRFRNTACHQRARKTESPLPLRCRHGAGTQLPPSASVHGPVAGTRCHGRKGGVREREVRRYLQSVCGFLPPRCPKLCEAGRLLLKTRRKTLLHRVPRRKTHR